MKPTTIKRIVVALALAVLAYFLLIKEPQAPQIITTIKELPSPSNTVQAPPAPPETPINKPIATPEKPSAIAQTPPQVSKTKSIVDKINANDLKVQYLNPDAPCPAKQIACYAQPGGMTIDASCPTYKPVWAYISLDKGLSWFQVGCYATELDAEKALAKAEQTGIVKTNPTQVATGKIKPTEKPSSQKQIEPSQNNLGTIVNAYETESSAVKPAEKPVEPSQAPEKPTNVAAEKKDEKVADNKPIETKSIDTKPADSKPAETKTSTEIVKPPKPEKSKPAEDLTVNFKTAFGLVSVEKRTYPNIEMKQKAIKMWDNGQRLLEPDGSINEKYTVKPKDTVLLPGDQ